MFQTPKGLPPKREIAHEIFLQQNTPLPNIGMYRLLVIENEVFKKQVKELLENGIIRPSSSSCGPWRMCMDFRSLNKITVKNHYPLPHIDDWLDQLKHANYFTRLDL